MTLNYNTNLCLYFSFIQIAPPTLTQYRLTYTCGACTFSPSIPPLNFNTIPTIPITNQATPITICSLFSNFVSQPVQMNCSQCNTAVQGTLNALPGKFTLLYFDRMTHGTGPSLVRTPLSITRSNGVGYDVVGDMIACISHSGNAQGGHWTCYTYVNGTWYFNDDSQQIVTIQGHPFDDMMQNSAKAAALIVFENR